MKPYGKISNGNIPAGGSLISRKQPGRRLRHLPGSGRGCDKNGPEQARVPLQTRGSRNRHHQHRGRKPVRREISRMQLDPSQLEQSGVMLPILVQSTMGIAMVDTGSRISLIDISFARELEINEEGDHKITGITGRGTFPKFSTEIEIPWLEATIPSPVGGAPLRESGITMARPARKGPHPPVRDAGRRHHRSCQIHKGKRTHNKVEPRHREQQGIPDRAGLDTEKVLLTRRDIPAAPSGSRTDPQPGTGASSLHPPQRTSHKGPSPKQQRRESHSGT